MGKILDPEDIGPGGAHTNITPMSIEEATQYQLALNRAALADPTSIASRQAAKLADDLAKLRERKAKRRAKNPYSP